MRPVSLLAGLVLLTLAACDSATSPGQPPAGDLDGSWGAEWNGNPGGASISLSLSTAGEHVSGTGEICGIGPYCAPGPVQVTGQRVSTFGPFSLTIRGDGGWVATYSGRLVGHDQLRGTLRQATSSHTLTLNRCGATSFC